MKLIFLAVFTALIISISSFAQSPEAKESFGKLSGQILDKNKVGVPKAKLIIEGKNFSREIESNDNGYYEI